MVRIDFGFYCYFSKSRLFFCGIFVVLNIIFSEDKEEGNI